MSRACICIALPLIVVLLIRIRTVLCPMTRHITILAGSVAWWHIGAALSSGALWKCNSVSLTKPYFGLILLLWWVIPCSYNRWAKLRPCYHKSFGLRCTYLIGPLATLGSQIDSIIVLLSQVITYKFIESSTLAVSQSFH
jgi:hypothetical protein